MPTTRKPRTPKPTATTTAPAGAAIAPRQRRRIAESRVVYGPCGPVAMTVPSSGYASTTTTPDAIGTRAVAMASSAHLDYQLDQMVAESQRLFRVNTIYRAIIRRLVDLIIGSGWRLQSRSVSETAQRAVEREWADFARAPEIRGLDPWPEFQRKVVTQCLVDGRIALLRHPSGRLQAIGGDQLYTYTPRQQLPNGHSIVSGVELDADGVPRKYHIARWDDMGMYRQEGKPVDAAAVIYIAHRDRFDETAGAPPLQAIFPFLHRLNDVFDSEAAAWQLLSRIALKINKKNGPAIGAAISEPSASGQTPPEAASRVTNVGSAIVFWGEEDEDIAGVERNIPSPNIETTIKAFLRFCGMELGLSLPFFLLDWSDTNYSSGRAAAAQFWRNAQSWVTLLQGGFSGCVEYFFDVRSRSLPRVDDLRAHEWVIDPFEPLDAEKENRADSSAVGGGFQTVSGVLRSRGKDRADVFRERALELAEASRLAEEHNAQFPNQRVTFREFLGNPEGAAKPEAALPAPQNGGTNAP